jgi:FkbM family methyltransferase
MNINDDVYFEEEAKMWWTPKAGYFQKENESFMNVVNPFLKNKNTVIQAGGHCGFMPNLFKKEFHTVYTFEPMSTSFLCLTLNNPENNVIKMQACLGDKHGLFNVEQVNPNESGASFVNDGEVHLYQNGYGTPFTILPKEVGKIKVPMIMIDDLKLETCDFIQLDLEGYEYRALMGGQETILKYKPLLCLERVWSCRYGIDENVTDTLLRNWNYIEVASINTDHIYQYKGN